MIIFLHGPDDYRRSEKKRALIAEVVKRHAAIGVGYFDLEEKDALESLDAFLRAQSIFEPSKLAVLENAFTVETKALAKFLQPFINTKNVTILIVEKDKPVKALAFLLEKPVLAQKFDALAPVELAAWASTEAKNLGVTLAPSAATFLAQVYAGDTWGLATELQKISGLAAGRNGTKPIEKKDLNGFGLEAAPNYWGLISGLKSFDIRGRLSAFEAMLASNDPPAKIFNSLASQWAEKTPHMAEYDVAVKSGKVDYEEALVDLLIS